MMWAKTGNRLTLRRSPPQTRSRVELCGELTRPCARHEARVRAVTPNPAALFRRVSCSSVDYKDRGGYGPIREEGCKQGEAGNARAQGGIAAQWPLGTQSQEPQAGDRDWFVGGASLGRESPEEKSAWPEKEVRTQDRG